MTASLQELQEMVEIAEIHEGELYAQYRSECSLYGDAWPGAQIDLQHARKTVIKLQKLVVNHPDFVMPEVYVDFDDIPF